MAKRATNKVRLAFYQSLPPSSHIAKLPVEQQEAELPQTAPGGEVKIEIKFRESRVPLRIRFDVFRPCRFSVFSLEWKS
jgi:hypothetical protein